MGCFRLCEYTGRAFRSLCRVATFRCYIPPWRPFLIVCVRDAQELRSLCYAVDCMLPHCEGAGFGCEIPVLQTTAARLLCSVHLRLCDSTALASETSRRRYRAEKIEKEGIDAHLIVCSSLDCAVVPLSAQLLLQ